MGLAGLPSKLVRSLHPWISKVWQRNELEKRLNSGQEVSVVTSGVRFARRRIVHLAQVPGTLMSS